MYARQFVTLFPGRKTLTQQAAAIFAKYRALGRTTAWWDPSDFSANFQDSAGTTPVTALEQPAGKRVDKSGGGNHSIQATAASRPVISAKRNLLISSDTLATQSVTSKALPYTLSFTGTGTVTLSGTSTAGPLVGTGAGNRVSLTFTPTAGTLTLTVTGSVTLAQLEYGSVFTRYQQNTSASVYDAVGFPIYYAADGVDDGYKTAANVDLSMTDKVFWFGAVTKFSDVAAGLIGEFSPTVTTNNGSFYMAGPESISGNNYGFASKGTGKATALVSGQASPNTAVLLGYGDIAADYAAVEVNGVLGTSNVDQVTGNYGSYVYYSLRRGDTTLPFTGRMFLEGFIGGGITAAEAAVFKALATERSTATA